MATHVLDSSDSRHANSTSLTNSTLAAFADWKNSEISGMPGLAIHKSNEPPTACTRGATASFPELNRGARRLRPLGVGTGRRSCITARRHGKGIHTRAQKRQQVIEGRMPAFAQSQNKDAPQMLGRVFLTFRSAWTFLPRKPACATPPPQGTRRSRSRSRLPLIRPKRSKSARRPSSRSTPSFSK